MLEWLTLANHSFFDGVADSIERKQVVFLQAPHECLSLCGLKLQQRLINYCMIPYQAYAGFQSFRELVDSSTLASTHSTVDYPELCALDQTKDLDSKSQCNYWPELTINGIYRKLCENTLTMQRDLIAKGFFDSYLIFNLKFDDHQICNLFYSLLSARNDFRIFILFSDADLENLKQKEIFESALTFRSIPHEMKILTFPKPEEITAVTTEHHQVQGSGDLATNLYFYLNERKIKKDLHGNFILKNDSVQHFLHLQGLNPNVFSNKCDTPSTKVVDCPEFRSLEEAFHHMNLSQIMAQLDRRTENRSHTPWSLYLYFTLSYFVQSPSFKHERDQYQATKSICLNLAYLNAELMGEGRLERMQGVVEEVLNAKPFKFSQSNIDDFLASMRLYSFYTRQTDFLDTIDTICLRSDVDPFQTVITQALLGSIHNNQEAQKEFSQKLARIIEGASTDNFLGLALKYPRSLSLLRASLAMNRARLQDLIPDVDQSFRELGNLDFYVVTIGATPLAGVIPLINFCNRIQENNQFERASGILYRLSKISSADYLDIPDYHRTTTSALLLAYLQYGISDFDLSPEDFAYDGIFKSNAPDYLFGHCLVAQAILQRDQRLAQRRITEFYDYLDRIGIKLDISFTRMIIWEWLSDTGKSFHSIIGNRIHYFNDHARRGIELYIADGKKLQDIVPLMTTAETVAIAALASRSSTQGLNKSETIQAIQHRFFTILFMGWKSFHRRLEIANFPQIQLLLQANHENPCRSHYFHSTYKRHIHDYSSLCLAILFDLGTQSHVSLTELTCSQGKCIIAYDLTTHRIIHQWQESESTSNTENLQSLIRSYDELLVAESPDGVELSYGQDVRILVRGDEHQLLKNCRDPLFLSWVQDVLVAIHQQEQKIELQNHLEAQKHAFAEANLQLAQSVREKAHNLSVANNKISTIIESLPQGILSVNTADGYIDSEFSARSPQLLTILGLDQINPESNIYDLLLERTNIEQSIIDTIRSIFDMSIGENFLNFEINKMQLPSECQLNGRIIEIEFVPVLNTEEDIEQIIISLRDITHFRALQAQADDEQAFTEILSQIVEFGVERSFDLLQSFQGEVQGHDHKNLPTRNSRAYKNLFIFLHTYKGNFRSIRFSHLASIIHKLESHLQAQNQVQFSNTFTQLQSVLSKYIDIISQKLKPNQSSSAASTFQDDCRNIVQLPINTEERIQLIQEALKISEGIEFSELLRPTRSSLSSISQTLRKRCPTLNISSIPTEIDHVFVDRKSARKIESIMGHLIRNSVAHGFNEESLGTIYIEVYLHDQAIVSFWDSGRGLNLTDLARLTNEKLTDDELSDLIFVSGISTNPSVDEISGRGIGMGAVRDYIESCGGTIQIQWIQERDEHGNRPFKFMMTFPPGVFLTKPKALTELTAKSKVG